MNISNCAYESHSPAHMNKENLEWNLLLLSLIVNKKKKNRNFIRTAVTAASLSIICLDHTWDNILVHPAWSWLVLCEVLHKVYGMFEFYLFMNVIHFQPELAILTHEFHRSSHRKTDVSFWKEPSWHLHFCFSLRYATSDRLLNPNSESNGKHCFIY